MIKMIALDLDNTLLTSDKKISPVNEKELKRLHTQGIKVVLCTGRPINAIWNYIEQLGLNDNDDYTITFNGGLVVQNNTKQELFKRGMNKDALNPLYKYAKANGYPLDVLDFKQVYPLSDLKPSIYKQMLNAKIEFTPLEYKELPDESFSKVIMAAEPDVLDEALANMPTKVNDVYHIVRSQPKILEFLPLRVDKAYGLGALLSHYGWNFSNLMAFGDAENDAGMLEKANVGVAMSNATPEIKKIANQETLSNNEDGVAVFLKNYFK